MSKMLKSSDKSKLSAALSKVISAHKALVDTPRYSTRCDQMIDSVAIAANIAQKVKNELEPKEPQNPPDRPDSGRGDEDNTAADRPHTGRDKSSPGISGFPEEKEPREREKNKFNVDSNAHRAIARGDDSRVNADTLPGHSKRLGEGHKGPDDGDESGDPVNISKPMKDGRDTTQTAEADGTLGYFEAQAQEQDAKDDAEREDALASKRDKATEAAADSKKYDSENRLSTEAHGHQAQKAEQERAKAEQSAERDARIEKATMKPDEKVKADDKAKADDKKPKAK